MLLPKVFDDDLFDDFFHFDEFPFFPEQDNRKLEKKLYGHRAKHLMRTDIKETGTGYELMIDLPGFKKNEVKVSLENGYLTIGAQKEVDENEHIKEGERYIRRERYTGACQRSFYVGEEVTQEDIKGEFKHGILKLFIPKKEVRPAVEEKKYITIE